MLFDITSIMYAVLRNFIILCISLSIYSTKTQSAELTLDITSFTYSEVDTNDNSRGGVKLDKKNKKNT